MSRLRLLEHRLAICRLAANDAIPNWASRGEFFSITRTAAELSVVCAEDAVPDGLKADGGWRVLEVEGPLDFSLTGVLAAIADPLAVAGVSIFAISTFDTDYVLVKDAHVARAVEALRAAGHLLTSLPE